MRTFAILMVCLLVPLGASAGILDDIGAAIKGHVDDVKSRINATDEVIDAVTTYTSGEFRPDDIGSDFLHNGSGSVSIVDDINGDTYIQLGSDFKSTPGPDYHVYISTSTGIVDEESFYASVQIEVGELKAGSGATYYKLPEGVSVFDVKSVTIWCKRFGAFITSADMK